MNNTPVSGWVEPLATPAQHRKNYVLFCEVGQRAGLWGDEPRHPRHLRALRNNRHADIYKELKATA
jgi:hypothetical protein